MQFKGERIIKATSLSRHTITGLKRILREACLEVGSGVWKLVLGSVPTTLRTTESGLLHFTYDIVLCIVLSQMT